MILLAIKAVKPMTAGNIIAMVAVVLIFTALIVAGFIRRA